MLRLLYTRQARSGHSGLPKIPTCWFITANAVLGAGPRNLLEKVSVHRDKAARLPYCAGKVEFLELDPDVLGESRQVKVLKSLRGGLRKLLKRDGGMHRGVPEGVSRVFLEDLCLEQLKSPLSEVRYRHLSAWKASGSYHLDLGASNGKKLALVAKEARYTPDEIPALVGLGIRPGAPEYAVLSAASRLQNELLPDVFYSQEVRPKEHYAYIMEDLSATYRVADDARDIVFLAGQLPRLHDSLSPLFAQLEPRALIQYDDAFSQGLMTYAKKQLEAYVSQFPSADVDEMLALLPGVSGLRTAAEALCPAGFELRAIHGDFNSSNAMIHKENGCGIKLIDWEWGGYGLVHADLASLLKSASEEVQSQALEAYTQAAPQFSSQEHDLLYHWAQLERAVLDASFLATQRCEASHESELDLNWCVENSSRIAVTCCDALQQKMRDWFPSPS